MDLSAVTTRPGHIEIRKTAFPDAPRHSLDAVVRVDAVGICGTDLHIFDGTYPTTFPVVQGHEFTGLVSKLPSGYKGELVGGSRVAVEPATACGRCHACQRGARNTCDNLVALGVHRPGGLQHAVNVPVDRCHRADGLRPDTAALCEPLSVSMRAVMRADVGPADHVTVLGCGPIGLGAVIAAVDRGAAVMAVDLHPGRLALAGELGASATVQGLDELGSAAARWSGGSGPTVVVEATGMPVVAEAAFDIVATVGRIAMVGVSEQRASLSIRAFTRKELTVVGSRATQDFPAAVELVRRHQEEVSALVSHRFPLADAAAAFAFAAEHPDRTIKTLVEVA